MSKTIDQPERLVIYVDRENDLWRVAGRTADGEELMACAAPRERSDIGDPGPTKFPWTRSTVERWFGPLVPVTPDAEVSELAAVDAALHEAFGRDESAWSLEQSARYVAEIDAVHARFETCRAVAS
ncbi:MAG: hypothetical protein HOW97_34090 [Catenulispora sp.]|nr:hypothetical protein [Catenulispora sp.]